MPIGNVTTYDNITSNHGLTNGMFVLENTSALVQTPDCHYNHGPLNESVNCSGILAVQGGGRGYNWPILFLTPLIFFGVGGNILVCMAISLEKRLQSVTNYFLLSLAITDLLVCIIVMPFTVINDFTGKITSPPPLPSLPTSTLPLPLLSHPPLSFYPTNKNFQVIFHNKMIPLQEPSINSFSFYLYEN